VTREGKNREGKELRSQKEDEKDDTSAVFWIGGHKREFGRRSSSFDLLFQG